MTAIADMDKGGVRFRLRALTVLVAVVVVTGNAATAETDADRSDFRNVFYEDLLPRIDQFSETGVSHFSEILFDFARYQVSCRNFSLWTFKKKVRF
jgi:hypothetical protein